MAVHAGKKPDPQARGGTQFVRQARECLDRHPHFRGRVGMFDITCDGQILTIEGRVPTFYLKQLIGSALLGMEENVLINNHVQVCEGRETAKGN